MRCCCYCISTAAGLGWCVFFLFCLPSSLSFYFSLPILKRKNRGLSEGQEDSLWVGNSEFRGGNRASHERLLNFFQLGGHSKLRMLADAQLHLGSRIPGWICATGCQRPSQLFKTQNLETNLGPRSLWVTRVSLYPFWGAMQSLFDYLDCFLTLQCGSDCGCHSSSFLRSEQLTKNGHFQEQALGVPQTRSHPLKLMSLMMVREAVVEVSEGGAMGTAEGRRLDSSSVTMMRAPVLAPRPVLLTPSPHPFQPVSSPSNHR